MKLTRVAALVGSVTSTRSRGFAGAFLASSPAPVSLATLCSRPGSLAVKPTLAPSAAIGSAPSVPAFASPSSVNGPSETRLAMSSSSSPTSPLLSSSVPTLELRNGMKHPCIGFGTYKVGFIPASASAAVAGTESTTVQRTAKECVADALSVGYRFLECAEFYGNEGQVGEAIAESGVERKDLFLCSKVWTSTIEKGPDAVERQLERTLKDLGTDYLDLYLIHWPVPGKHVDAYKKLVELRDLGKVRGIGVSNYAWEDYVELKDAGVGQADLPLVNQIEINPFLYRRKTIGKFTDEGVVLQSYRSLRDGKAFDHPVLTAIADSHGRSAAQVLGRWCVQKGFVYTPKSVKKERMVENSQVFDFELSDDDMAELDELTTDENIRTFVGLYRKCVNRDTSKDGTMDGVKTDITED